MLIEAVQTLPKPLPDITTKNAGAHAVYKINAAAQAVCWRQDGSCQWWYSRIHTPDNTRHVALTPRAAGQNNCDVLDGCKKDIISGSILNEAGNHIV